MPDLQTAAVGLFAQVGSRIEPAPLNGIAHLFEHMVFKGAGGRSARDISEAIEEVGGDLNAATDRDATSFTATIMAEHVPLAVELIADMMLKPHFAETDLQREKDVVLQELAEARDTPSDMVFDELWSAAYEGQALGRSILGDESTIGSVTVADLHRWRDEHYRAQSVSLVAAGKVDHDQLVELAEAPFCRLAVRARRRPRTGALHWRDPPRPPPERTGADRPWPFPVPATPRPIIMPRGCSPTSSAAGPLRGCSSKLREDRGLAYSVSSTLHPYADTGLFYVYAATSRSQAAAAAPADRGNRRGHALVGYPARARPGADPGAGRHADVARNPLGPGPISRPPARRPRPAGRPEGNGRGPARRHPRRSARGRRADDRRPAARGRRSGVPAVRAA